MLTGIFWKRTKHFVRLIPLCAVCMCDLSKVYVKNALRSTFSNGNHVQPMMIVYCLNVNN